MRGISAYDRFSVISGIIMVFIYAAVGVIIITSNSILVNFSQTNRNIFGALIIAYGAYRGYKAYKKYTELKAEKNNQDYDANDR